MRLQTLRKKSTFAAQPLQGVIDFEGFAVSLKRHPDTKLEFFRNPLRMLEFIHLS